MFYLCNFISFDADRHASASEKEKREHEIKFKEIGEAYAVLTDSKKRAMYDRGQDINDPDGSWEHDGQFFIYISHKKVELT